jgi:glucosamine--fructose-6-phosphate aminotransferase (isomerizing)
MCGIFGYVGRQDRAAKLVLEGLKALEYRGYDSWGVAVVPDQSRKDNMIVIKKSAGKIGDAHVDELPAGTLAFGHTRWATHGGVTQINAHPHLDCSKTIAVIHNGIVENYEELKAMLVKKGHTFVSQTDTEVIVHLVEEYAKKMMFSKAVQKAFNELDGLNAIILINTKDHQMVAARNGSPLVVGFGNGENYLASDPAALVSHTKQVHFLEDNNIAIVDRDNIHIYNTVTGNQVRPRKQKLTWSPEEAVKGQYPYFMLKEIHEQPGILSEIASETPTQASFMAKALNRAKRIYVLGAGTSGHAARAATYIFSRIAGKLINWGIASEFDHRLDVVPAKSAVVALSQSGETMDLLELVKKLKNRRMKIMALCNVVGSTLWREAEVRLPLGAGPEKGVASTKAFITKIAHLFLIAHAMGGDIKKGQLLISRAARAAQKVLSRESLEHIKELAHKLKHIEHMFVIGRDISYATALESALKIKEISYIHAEGVAAGELKHGPLALVTKGTVCMVFAPMDHTHEDTLTAAREMKARGGYIIGISPKPNDVFDWYIPVGDAGLATIIPNVIAAQLLAYYLTIERGFDPDMPRNLAKSVTVK